MFLSQSKLTLKVIINTRGNALIPWYYSNPTCHFSLIIAPHYTAHFAKLFMILYYLHYLFYLLLHTSVCLKKNVYLPHLSVTFSPKLNASGR